MSFFLRFNRKSGKSDDALYVQVWREIESKNVDEGLWARLWAANKGDEEKTKTAYLNERVKQLQEEAKAEEAALPVVLHRLVCHRLLVVHHPLRGLRLVTMLRHTKSTNNRRRSMGRANLSITCDCLKKSHE